jgi:AcrR family transcriptional regulator
MNTMTDKKEHIINNAIELFARNGFEGTSIRDLAAAADVNVAMVNYYFGTKEKLFESLVEMKSAATKGILTEIANDSTLSGIEKINSIIEVYVTKLFSGRQFHRVIHQELMLGNRETLQTIIVNLLFPNSLTIKEIIKAAIKKGEFREVDPELTVATLMGTIHQVLQSKKFCNKFLNRDDNYVPYDDPKFRKRVIDHLREIMAHHLLKQ